MTKIAQNTGPLVKAEGSFFVQFTSAPKGKAMNPYIVTTLSPTFVRLIVELEETELSRESDLPRESTRTSEHEEDLFALCEYFSGEGRFA